MRDIYVIGGPNGAGKTTAAQTFLAGKLDTVEFVNADEIARGLSPLHPEGVAVSAGRLMLERMGSLAAGDLDFAIESTLSGGSLLRFLRDCKALGWRITLIFLWLPSPKIALKRVAKRAAAGGHSVPADDVVRRYRRGVRNLLTGYLPLADIAGIYDNAGDERRLIADRAEGDDLLVHDAERWRMIEKASRCPI